MSFEIVTGSPPYQESDGGAGASSKPVYQEFVYASNEVVRSYSVMIMPACWYARGEGLDQFREDMFTDKHIKLFYDYQCPDGVFPNANNRGGVCFVVRDRRFDNPKGQTTIVSNYGGGKMSMQHHSLKTKGLKIFICHQESATILTKATKRPDFSPIANYISSRKSFGIEGNAVEDNNLFKRRRTKSNPISCYGRPSARGHVPLSLVKTNVDWTGRYKAYIPYVNNIDTELSDNNLNAFIGAPNTVCSETFLAVGADLNLLEKEATNIVLYLKTKMVRFLHSLSKSS